MNITTQTWIARIRAAFAGQRERGASALEWALIAAIAVVAATLIGTAVYNAVSNKADQVGTCADQPVGSNC